MATVHTIPDVYPAISYENGAAAIEWLERVFGLRRIFVASNDDGTIAHAEMGIGNGVIMLGSVKENGLGAKTPKQIGSSTGQIYVRLDDVDAHYRQAASQGAEIVREIQDTDYGSREYAARDLDGHVWSFGTYGVDAAQQGD